MNKNKEEQNQIYTKELRNKKVGLTVSSNTSISFLNLIKDMDFNEDYEGVRTDDFLNFCEEYNVSEFKYFETLNDETQNINLYSVSKLKGFIDREGDRVSLEPLVRVLGHLHNKTTIGSEYCPTWMGREIHNL
jgi:hypothetical protein